MTRIFLLYFNTIKHLKFIQIVHQIINRLGLPKKKVTPTSVKQRRLNKPPKTFLKKKQSLYEGNKFQFFGIKKNLSDVGWQAVADHGGVINITR